MLEKIEPPSELDQLKARISEALWLSGKLHYELEVKAEELEVVKITLRNLNHDAKKFQEKMEKELKKEAMKVVLPTPAPSQVTEVEAKGTDEVPL